MVVAGTHLHDGFSPAVAKLFEVVNQKSETPRAARFDPQPMVLSHEMYMATTRGDLRGVEVALAMGEDINDVVVEGDDQCGLLFLTCFSEHMPHEDARTGMIRFLLESGADPFGTDPRGDGIFCFALACCRINADQVRLFVEHGADVNVRDEDGSTPLVFAVRSKKKWSLEVVRTLLQLGARHDIVLDIEEELTIVDIAMLQAKGEARIQPAADLLLAVKNAGSWHRYCVEPSVKLLALRHLSLAGRAVPPPNLARLFGARATGCASRTRSKRLRRVDAPPAEVFRLILEFWGGNHWPASDAKRRVCDRACRLLE